MGASLLAMAVWQSTKMLNGPAPSRASSLPQWDLQRSQNLCPPLNPCGSEPAPGGDPTKAAPRY
ncbi:hypothetical protein FHK92_12380 [Pseudomonas brassicacearum subsp. neoaurantiaca]|uniref:Uncharacterized protein n=1 Tax=Pseudomonas brassicacearum subsp. neoaurantiaca TaxID=494916 RepID=A0A7V8UBJ6_9PSED|nr:hypothetical protein [Pseudomonas brassicacearum subsp. neoaurantiaca]